jgi:hypothetical protein
LPSLCSNLEQCTKLGAQKAASVHRSTLHSYHPYTDTYLHHFSQLGYLLWHFGLRCLLWWCGASHLVPTGKCSTPAITPTLTPTLTPSLDYYTRTTLTHTHLPTHTSTPTPIPPLHPTNLHPSAHHLVLFKYYILLHITLTLTPSHRFYSIPYIHSVLK